MEALAGNPGRIERLRPDRQRTCRAGETAPLTVDKTTVPAGGTVILSGSGCAPGGEVRFRAIRGDINAPEIELGGGDAQADLEGNFTATLEIPAGTSPGPLDIDLRCGATPPDPQFLVARITVTADELAFTGSSTMMLAAIAGLAIAAGAALLTARPIAVRWSQSRRPRR